MHIEARAIQPGYAHKVECHVRGGFVEVEDKYVRSFRRFACVKLGKDGSISPHRSEGERRFSNSGVLVEGEELRILDDLELCRVEQSQLEETP